MADVPIPSAGVDAVIDDEDWLLVTQYRWYLSGKGYVTTYIPHPEGGMVSFPSRPREHRARMTPLLLSRLIMGLEYGDRRQVDHDNHDKLDNRRSNLVVVTQAENNQNILEGRGTSRYRGVCWDARKNKWRAGVKLNYKLHNLGYFDSEEEAARIASEWRAANMPHSPEGRRSQAR
jgi:hypothetical protein